MHKINVFLRHLWLDDSDSRRLIPADLRKRLANCVALSEKQHSGEIRICIESALPASYLWRLDRTNTLAALTRQRAVMVFGKLRVWDTEHNNGVLIYLLLAEHAIEIVADRGLSKHVGTAHWEGVVAQMSTAFKAGRYENGLTEAIAATSAVLVQYFAVDGSPSGPANPDELPNTPMLL